MINGGGTDYTVEEVGDLLGIPRPTLYRYLREYSIPHLRKSGRISIPEDSFEKIRRARDLHKEGLSTETVRRTLREGSGTSDTQDLAKRLDRVSRSLETLRGEARPADDDTPHALRTILARQSLLISAIFNLTEMVEELMRKSGQQSRTAAYREVEVGMPERSAVPGLPETRLARSREVEPAAGNAPESGNLPAPTVGRGNFGALARRRRRRAGMALATLVLAAVLLWILPALEPGRVFETLITGEARSEGASWLPAENGAPRYVKVPDVSGLTPKDARDRLTGAGLKPGPQKEAPSEDVPEGKIFAQSPSQGKEVESGRTVDLMVSSGGRPEVPDVAGSGMEEASRILTEAGYEVAEDNFMLKPGPEPVGTVTTTDPPAGSEAEPGTPITLVVSVGRPG